MSKWQLDLVQDGKELRKFGECKSTVYCTLEYMLKNMGLYLKSASPYTIYIKKTNRPCGNKWVVEVIVGTLGSSKVKRSLH